MSNTTLLVAAAVLLCACTGTEGGNPVRAKMSLVARSSDSSIAALDGEAPPGGLRVDGAWALVQDVRFERSDVCDHPDAVVHTVIAGSRAVALLGDGTVEGFDLDPGGYCRLRLRIDDAKDVDLGGAPAELVDHGVLVRGVRADGVAVTILSRMKLDVELRSRGAPFAIDSDTPAVILAFDAAVWLSGIDLAAADVEAGAVLVDETHNRPIENQFDASLRAAMQLFRDRNADGRLGNDETADVLAE